MKKTGMILFVCFFCMATVSPAAIRYVSHDTNYNGPATGFTVSSNAATNLQQAYDVCNKNDIIMIIDNYTNYSMLSMTKGTNNITVTVGNGYAPVIRPALSQQGFWVNGGTNIRLIGLTINGIFSNTEGIELRDATSCVVSNCTILNHLDSIYCLNTAARWNGHRIVNNRVEGYIHGVFLYRGISGTLVANNVITHGLEKGIWLNRNTDAGWEMCKHNYILNNVVLSNGLFNDSVNSFPAGIYIQDAVTNFIQKNICAYNGNGIVLDGSYCASNKIFNNTLFRNDMYVFNPGLHHSGIEIVSGVNTNNQILGNISVSNEYGFYSGNAWNLKYNASWGNGNDCNANVNGGSFMSGIGCKNNWIGFRETKSNFNMKAFSAAINSSFSNNLEFASMGVRTITVVSKNNLTNATTTNDIKFTTDLTNGSIPGDGKIVITYPDGFDLSGVAASDISSTTLDGSFTVSRTGQVVTISRVGGTRSLSGKTEKLIIGKVKNRSVVSTSNRIILKLQDASGNTLVEDEYSNDFYVGSPFLLVGSEPSSNQRNYPISSTIKLRFSQAVDINSVNTNLVYLLDAHDRKVSCSISFVDNTNIIIDPVGDLEPHYFYEVVVKNTVLSSLGSFLDKEYRISFYTGSGIMTKHYSSFITCDGKLDEWNRTNSVSYDLLKKEILTNDLLDSTPDNVALTNLWGTWDTNVIYFALKKNSSTAYSGAVFYNFVFFDISMDYQGATNFVFNGFSRRFMNKRRPDFRVWAGDRWTGGYSTGIHFEKWNGNSWSDVQTNGVFFWQGKKGTANTNNNVLEFGIKADQLTNYLLGMTNKVPGRMAVLAFSKLSNSTPSDFCPETTNFIDITPDNNGDGVLDNYSSSSFVLRKSITNITLSGSDCSPIPGSSIQYSIFYSNKGPGNGVDIAIIDKLPKNLIYISNGIDLTLAPGSWTVSFSSNTDIDDFVTNSISPQLVKRIRFNKVDIPVGEKGKILISVLIR